MIGRLRSFVSALRARPGMLALVAVLAVTTVAVGGFFAYRTYDYVQHDNDFCLSCHLMVEPFEEFARSAHRGMGCKACHQPTTIERSTMGLTQVVEQPDSLGVHAEVPDELCVQCHMENDPETWKAIENSAGHLTHLESDSLALKGLMCVQCHSSSVHQFTPTDQTCAQSECHTDISVQLGRMGDFTIHCTACHSFLRPMESVAGSGPMAAATGRSGLRAEETTCLSCHAMRALVALPPDDPHEADCAACHNPHEQTIPEQAIESCSSSDCHGGADELSGYHQGLAPGTFEACLTCHIAHDFHLEGSDCQSCHEDVSLDGPPPASRGGGRIGVLEIPVEGIRLASLDAGFYLHAAPQAASADTVFYHSQHVDAQCVDCHSTQGEHGAQTVITQEDCRSCHHEAPVVQQRCGSCHESSEHAAGGYQRTHLMAFDASTPRTRILPFVHAEHVSEDCQTCHTEGSGLKASSTSCSSCHEQHHEPDVSCRSCHEEAPVEEHPVEVHFGCSGSGCHTDTSFDMVPRVDEFCLTCHQDLVEGDVVEHKQESNRTCASCHTLPAPVARSD